MYEYHFTNFNIVAENKAPHDTPALTVVACFNLHGDVV